MLRLGMKDECGRMIPRFACPFSPALSLTPGRMPLKPDVANCDIKSLWSKVPQASRWKAVWLLYPNYPLWA